MLQNIKTIPLALPCRAFATVPEYFGKESKYTAGSGFLGVPENSGDVRLL